jgi:transcriptional regulator with XRE-family HTH domain
MDDIRVGRWFGAARLRLGLRQTDIARIARVSAQTIARFEAGLLAGMSLRTCREIATVVGIELWFAPRSRHLGDLERLVDRRHAALVDLVIGLLRTSGWEVQTEYSFNHYGDRGSVDVLAWRSLSRTLLIIEVKSELRDVQATLRALDVKARVVPGCLRQDRRWQATSIGVVLVLPAMSTERDHVARHREIFAAALPARTVDVKHWLCGPDQGLRGIWFVPVPREVIVTQRVRGSRRVKLPRQGVSEDLEPVARVNSNDTVPFRRLWGRSGPCVGGGRRRRIDGRPQLARQVNLGETGFALARGELVRTARPWRRGPGRVRREPVALPRCAFSFSIRGRAR